MSDYGENVADYESDLGEFGAEMEASGFDAVETTETGRLKDSQLQVSAENGGAQYVIDTVADAKQAEAHNKKENEKAADAREAIREVFARAHQHVDDHKYNFKLDGKDYEISHGDLKDFMKTQSEQFAKRAKTEKDSKKRAQMEQDSQMLLRLYQHMDTVGPLSDEQIQEFNDVLDRNPVMKAEFKSNATDIGAADNNEANMAEINRMDEFKRIAEKEPETIEASEIKLDTDNSIVSMSGDKQAEPAPDTQGQQVAMVRTLPNDMNLNF